MTASRLSILAAACVALSASAATAQQSISWTDSISSLGLDATPGTSYTFTCPYTGDAGAVWGSGVYTHDSAICPAARHAGVLTTGKGDGAEVTVIMRPGRGSYESSEQNGVATSTYGSWGHSYTFEGVAFDEFAIGWRDTADGLGVSRQPGLVFEYHCPPNGDLGGTVWGTDVYTDDSAVCVAAVHDGRISSEAGGVVFIRIEGPRDSYAGTERNGVTTSSYGAWGRSYLFVKG